MPRYVRSELHNHMCRQPNYLCSDCQALELLKHFIFCCCCVQSVMLVELDGPRKRTVGIQVVGQTGSEAAGANGSS